MKEYKDWLSDLNDDAWFAQRCKEKYPRKNLGKIAENLYDWMRSKNLEIDIKDCRSAFFRFANTHADDKVFQVTELQGVEGGTVAKKVEPATGERRDRWLKVWQYFHNKASKNFKPSIPMSHKEQIEQGDWIPKKDVPFIRDEFETQLAAITNVQTIRKARTKKFKDAFPDAEQDEINEYLKKYSHIDDPDNLLPI